MMRDCGNKPPSNGSSSNKFPGNNPYGSGSSDSQPGNRPPCTKVPGTGLPDKTPSNKFFGNGPSGNGSSGSWPPGNRPPGSIQDGKREALQLCKKRIGCNEQMGAALKSSNSETEREKPTFVFGGNLSTVPSTSEKWTDDSHARPAHFKEIPDLAKALQTSLKETLSESRLHTTNNVKVSVVAKRPSSAVSKTGGGQEKEERIKQLEQRVGDLEQQFREEKAAKETLLASVERVLAGEAVEETCSELKLANLIHDITAKILRREQGGKLFSLDLNGNEAQVEDSTVDKNGKRGSPNIERNPHVEMGLKSRPGKASAKPHPGVSSIY